VEFADWLEIEHRVKGRNFERADMRQAEKIRDMANSRLRQPAAGLLLRTPQQRDDR
jgi:hypothetical protein